MAAFASLARSVPIRRSTRVVALAHHLVRVVAAATALFAWPTLAPAFAIALYFAGFMLTHELAHGALGLPRRANQLALALAGIATVTSGHAMRVMHLRHHVHALAPDDLEGAPARMTAGQALVAAPYLALRLVAAAWRAATARDRRWHAAEHLAIAGFAIIALTLGPRALRLYVLVAFANQLLAPFWAGYLVHRPPRWLVVVAHHGARAGSLALKTLVVHDAHHARPKLPTYVLVPISRSAGGQTLVRDAGRPADVERRAARAAAATCRPSRRRAGAPAAAGGYTPTPW